MFGREGMLTAAAPGYLEGANLLFGQISLKTYEDEENLAEKGRGRVQKFTTVDHPLVT